MIQEYLKPVLILSRCCGLMPLKAMVVPAKQYSVSYLWISYNLVLALVHIILSYFLFQSTFDSEYTLDIPNLGKYISIYSSVAPNFIFILFLTLNCRTFMKCLHTISMVIIYLSHTEVRLSYKNLIRRMYRQVVVGILLCVIIPSSATLDGSLLLPLALFLQAIVLTTSVLLFISTSTQVTDLFAALNLTLSKNACTWATVQTLSRCQLYLTDATEDLNSVFTGPIVHLTLTCFSGVLFTTFRGLQMLYRYSEDGLLIVTMSVHTIYLTGMLAAILHTCHVICDQLKIFSLQVLHRPVKIHAWGIFNFDYSLLLSLATAATTYLVILVQFDQAKNDLPNNYNNRTNLD